MLTTPEGKEHFTMGLSQMRNAVEEANALNILNELMTCFSPWRTFEQRYSRFRGRSLKDILDDEAFFFGIFQRVDGAFQMLDTRISHLQRYYRGKGNTYILHRKLIQYNTQVPQAQTEYWIGGPEAISRFNKGSQGVTTDGRGNVLVTVDTYQVENMRPLDPLKRYITYGEYNEFRDLKRGGDYKNHFDSHRHIGIYNVDDDQWSLISTDYIIDNCCRFDESTGEPLGINHSQVRRHETQYAPNEMMDSYHYTAKKDGEVVLLPVRYMGQIDLSHITLGDILTIADVANEKMTDLHSKYQAGDIKRIVEGGLEVLRYIEGLPYDGAAEAFIKAARDLNAAKYPRHTGGGHSYFAPNFDAAAFGQNIHSGWDLPNANAAWAAHQAPFGYGSAAGYLTIAAALNEAGTPAAYNRKHGYSGEMAQKVSDFVTLLQDYVSYLKTYFPMNPALEAVCAAPWWHRPTALHTLWDTVIVHQYRLPYHVLNVADAAAGASAVAGGAVRQLSAVVDRSKAAREFLADHLLGRMETAADQAAKGNAALISAHLGEADAAGRNLVFNNFQRRKEAAVDAKELFERLPAFAQVRHSGVDAATGALESETFAGSGLPVRVVVGRKYSAANTDSEPEKRIRDAYDLLTALIFSTATDLTAGTVSLENAAKREGLRAILISAVSAVAIDDLKGQYNLQAASALAARILRVYDDLIEPFIPKAVLLSNRAADSSATEELLDRVGPQAVIANVREKLLRAISGAAENPYRYRTEAEVNNTILFFERTVNITGRVIEELKSADSPVRGRASAVNQENYMPSPLLYSPSQLVDHVKVAAAGGVPAALLASPEVPAQPMDLAYEAQQARAITDFLQRPTQSNLKRLAPELIPAGTVTGTPVSNNPILAHIRRARMHDQDKKRARSLAASEQVGSPGLHSRSAYTEDAISLDPTIVHSARVGGSASAAARAHFSSGQQREISSRLGSMSVKRSAPADDGGRSAAHEELIGKRQRQFGGVDPSLPEMLLSGNFINSWNAVDENGSRGILNGWTSKVYLLTPFNAKVLRNWATHNLVVPIRALLFRFAVLGTYSIIKMQAGAETGHTYIGNSLFTWNNDGVNQGMILYRDIYPSAYSLFSSFFCRWEIRKSARRSRYAMNSEYSPTFFARLHLPQHGYTLPTSYALSLSRRSIPLDGSGGLLQ